MLPSNLLAAIEAHSCVSGCYSHEIPVSVVTDPNKPPQTMFHAACQDCLMFHVGALASALPSGMTQYSLAQEMAAHVRIHRGYKWAFSGYHASGAGFWLTAVYFGDGLFLVDASRNHGGTKDLDCLIQAFKGRFATPDDLGMLDPSNYGPPEIVHLDASKDFGAPKTKADIIRLGNCSLTPRLGFRRIAILEYLPMVTGYGIGNVSPPANIPTNPPLPSKIPSPPVSISSNVSIGNKSPGRNRPWASSDVGTPCDRCNRKVKENPIGGKTTFDCMCPKGYPD